MTEIKILSALFVLLFGLNVWLRSHPVKKRNTSMKLIPLLLVVVGLTGCSLRPSLDVHLYCGKHDTWQVCVRCPAGFKPKVQWRPLNGEVGDNVVTAFTDAQAARCVVDWKSLVKR
jgi:hypothetical protein